MTFLEEVRAEIDRTRRKFPGQEDTVTPEGWLAILVEEVGEVARELNERMLNPRDHPGPFLKRLREELVQCAAMCERMEFAARRQIEPAADRRGNR